MASLWGDTIKEAMVSARRQIEWDPLSGEPFPGSTEAVEMAAGFSQAALDQLDEARREQAVLHGSLSQDQCDSVGVALGFRGITPKMSAAGADTIDHINGYSDLGIRKTICDRIYLAMHAVAPVELVSEGERQAVRERDEARAERDRWIDHTKFVLADRLALRTELMAARDALASKDDRIAELDSQLVAAVKRLKAQHDMWVGFAAASVPVSEPEPNPFRDFGHDPRRMGPL